MALRPRTLQYHELFNGQDIAGWLKQIQIIQLKTGPTLYVGILVDFFFRNNGFGVSQCPFTHTPLNWVIHYSLLELNFKILFLINGTATLCLDITHIGGHLEQVKTPKGCMISFVGVPLYCCSTLLVLYSKSQYF